MDTNLEGDEMTVVYTLVLIGLIDIGSQVGTWLKVQKLEKRIQKVEARTQVGARPIANENALDIVE